MIISRYLIKEVFNALFAVSFVMLLIFLSNQLIRYLKYAAKGKIAAGAVMQLMGLEIPYLLVLLLPLGMYLGIIIAYGRLYAENEMRVMQACGLTTKKLIMITSLLGVFISLVVMGLALWLNPYLATEKDKIIQKNIATDNILDTLIPGRFQVSGDDSRVIYVESIARDRQKASNLFIAEQKKKSESIHAWSVLSAQQGYQIRDPNNHDRFVVATDGFRYEGSPGENGYKIIQFEKYAVRVVEQIMGAQHQPQEGKSTKTLIQNYIDPQSAGELQWRLSMPLSAFLLALLAIPLSQSKPRQGRFAHLFPAILIYIIYLNLLFVTRDWVEIKTISVGVGMWWVHGLIVAMIIILFFKQSNRFSYLFRWKRRKVEYS